MTSCGTAAVDDATPIIWCVTRHLYTLFLRVCRPSGAFWRPEITGAENHRFPANRCRGLSSRCHPQMGPIPVAGWLHCLNRAERSIMIPASAAAVCRRL